VSDAVYDGLFAIVGGEDSVQKQEWPQFDQSKLASDVISIVIQVNGKVKDNMEFAAGSSEQEIINQALQSEKISGLLNGQTPKRTIYVAGRLLNIVI
jgi:leucyl-tRNA synthetase